MDDLRARISSSLAPDAAGRIVVDMPIKNGQTRISLRMESGASVTAWGGSVDEAAEALEKKLALPES